MSAAATAPSLDRVQAELDRAQSDYLAVSRSRKIYADADTAARAEQDAWEKLMAMVALRDEAAAAK